MSESKCLMHPLSIATSSALLEEQDRKPEHNHTPTTSTSHPEDPIPEEPQPNHHHAPSLSSLDTSLHSSAPSMIYSETASESELPDTPVSGIVDLAEFPGGPNAESTQERDVTRVGGRRRASTKLISQNANDLRRLLKPVMGGTHQIEKVCCGGGCSLMNKVETEQLSGSLLPIVPPDNDAYRSLRINLGELTLGSKLDKIVDLAPQKVFFTPFPAVEPQPQSTVELHPPTFVQPHPPYNVYSAPIHHARALTRPGAEKRTYHFDLDVTNYPTESGTVDFVVGGAVGVCAPNSDEVVDDVFDELGVPRFVRDRPVVVKTKDGRWPTIWGDDKARELVTTRRELLTWCTDLQSYPPTKRLFRLLAEYAEDENEKKILMYLSAAQGQAAFCDLRTGPHITVGQLLHAFPSSKPPLSHLLSTLQQLMPRFYSLSNDPHVTCDIEGRACRRIIEVAVTVHETDNWRGGPRTGVGSGFFERCAKKIAAAEAAGVDPSTLDLRVPMFRGLMSNPLAREFVSDGPMLLIGAGVGVAPFRGFVQRRLKNANCANKVWVLQGVRDSLLDELYSGEWGVHEDEVKKVVQSRKGEGKYVQEEVRVQADLVWYIINALDGRVFVCGSSKGMGEGVEAALVDVAIDKGKMNLQEAQEFWQQKKGAGQYISETW